MASEFLLDTNIVSAALDVDPNVWLGIVSADQVALASIVVGELQFGAINSAHVDENLQQLEDFVASVPVLPVDLEVARRYGRIRWELQSAGTKIPQNDIWIAATAMRHQLTVATRDAHFSHVAGLKTAAW